jgi:hypothetical protein
MSRIENVPPNAIRCVAPQGGRGDVSDFTRRCSHDRSDDDTNLKIL